MKLSQFANFRAEDYPDFKEAPRFFSVLNPIFIQLRQIFDGNVEFENNIKSVLKSFDQTGVTFPIVFVWPYSQFQPVELRVCKAEIDGTAVVLLPSWSYDASTSQISITSLVKVTSAGTFGIVPTSRYKFTIRATV